jgi:hypothetical protein
LAALVVAMQVADTDSQAAALDAPRPAAGVASMVVAASAAALPTASAVVAVDSTAVAVVVDSMAVVVADTVVAADTGNFELLRERRLAKSPAVFYCAKSAAISAILAAACG